MARAYCALRAVRMCSSGLAGWRRAARSVDVLFALAWRWARQGHIGTLRPVCEVLRRVSVTPRPFRVIFDGMCPGRSECPD